MQYLPFIIFTVFTNAVAQLMLKQGMITLGPVGSDGPTTALSIVTMLFKVILNPWVFFGLCTFVVSMASHLYVLSKVELSFAYPFLSLAYVLVAVVAWIVFAEDLNMWRIAGIGFICVGTVLVAQSDQQSDKPVASLSDANETQEAAKTGASGKQFEGMA